jgi:methylated-DNA-[protein]-cysteine S-methyltransferase
MRLLLKKYSSPCSPLLVVTDDDGALRALEFADKEARMHRFLKIHYGTYELKKGEAPAAILRALDDYFDGDYAALDRIKTATGGTLFQRDVWKALREIPPGTTTSYGELARRIGRAGASRAVGAANGSNPIAIVVPCHRVIGASGTLTGYGGGLPRKRWLLDHEKSKC